MTASQKRSVQPSGITAKTGLLLSASGLGLLSLVALLMTPGCVTDEEYREASRGAETTRMQLDEVRTESTALEQQLKTLEAEVADLTSRSQALSEELEQLRESQAEEQLAFDEAVGKMHQAVMTLKSQNRNMKQAYDEQQKENIALASLVQRYSRELEELQAADSRPAPPPAPTAVPAVAQIPAQGIQPNGHSMTPAPIPPSPVVPVKPAAPVTTPPADEGWLDMLMRWLMWLWHLVF